MNTHRQFVLSSARAYAYDDYLAALFTPFDKREDLITLSAYYGEIARIPLIVKEEILAQIRFQWWRDTLEKGAPSGHPVADTLLLVKEKHQIPLELLLSFLDQREAELHPSLISNPNGLRDYLRTLEITHFRLRALLLGCSLNEQTTALVIDFSPLLGALRFCLRLPSLFERWEKGKRTNSTSTSSQDSSLSHHQALYSLEKNATQVSQIARDYDRVRQRLRDLKGNQRLLFLPLGLVGSYLKVLQMRDRVSVKTRPVPLPISRFLSLFLAAKFGRF